MKPSELKHIITEILLENLNEDPQRQRYQPDTSQPKTWDLDSAHANNQTSFIKRDSAVNKTDPKWQFENGKLWGAKDKISGTQRELDKYPPMFAKGYKMVQEPGWWSKFNEKLTGFLADLGSSRLR